MSATFTLGILETGRPPENLAKDHANYADMFASMVKATAPDHWDYRFYAVLDGELPQNPSECDAYLITGSKFGAYEDIDWIHGLKDFIRRAYDAGSAMVGICFGHQILAQSLGGRVVKSDKGWGVGVHHYQWTKDKPAWLDETALEASEDFAIVAFHQDQIVDLPFDARVLATSDFCPYAALAYKDQAISFQGHPEFSVDYEEVLIEDRREAVLGDQVADKAAESLAQPIDREAIGVGIVAFLEKFEASHKG